MSYAGNPFLRAARVLCRLMICCVALSGCTDVVGGHARAGQKGPVASGPIHPSQLVELLSASGSVSVVADSPLTEDDMQSALFIGADPAECHGVVAFGRYPLFPHDYTGREARTQQDHRTEQHQLLEASASYPSGFDAAAFLVSVRRSVSGCQRPVAVWGDLGRRMTVHPDALVQSPPEVARWATSLAGQKWVCEFGVIAKANVVSEIVACSPDRSVDIGALITRRLEKIDELLESTA